MYSKKTRVHCYAFTLLPALIGLVLWSTNPQTVFPLVVRVLIISIYDS